MKRLFLGVVSMIVLAIAIPAFSAAASYDTSYQNGGKLLLPQLRGIYGQVAQSCEVTGSNLSIAGRFGSNAPGFPTSWRADQRLAITRVKLKPRQPMTLGIADVRWHAQRIPTKHVLADQDFADDGSFAYVTQPSKRSARIEAKLFRVGAEGRRIAGFGRNGYITVALGGGRVISSVQVIALPGGKTLVIASTKSARVLIRYTKRGRLDESWGNRGVVELPPIPAHTQIAPADFYAATATPAGGLLITASGVPGKPQGTTLGVLKLTAAGRLDTKWTNGGFWTPPAPSSPTDGDGNPFNVPTAAIRATVLKNGSFAILYGDAVEIPGVSINTTLKLAYVDQHSGITTLFNEQAGTYNQGGDGGFPDENPWVLGPSSNGPIFAHGEGLYGGSGGTYNAEATRFSLDANQPIKHVKFGGAGFATSAMAVDPASKHLYLCGSFGAYSAKASDKAKRGQRKAVAITRLAL